MRVCAMRWISSDCFAITSWPCSAREIQRLDRRNTPIWKQFAARLVERRPRENDLSDALWALCGSIPAIQTAVEEFFDVQGPTTLQREFNLRIGGRADFAFLDEAEKPVVLVESKIYDRHYRFDKYAKAQFPFHLITNHILEAKDLERSKLCYQQPVKRWKDLLERIAREALRNGLNHGELVLIEGFLIYAKGVCHLDLKKVTLNDVDTLRALANFLDHLEAGREDASGRLTSHGIRLEPIEMKKKGSESCKAGYWTGIHFKVYKKGCRQVPLVWVGLSYDREVPILLSAMVDHGDKRDSRLLDRLNNASVHPFSEGVMLELSPRGNSEWEVKFSDAAYKGFTEADAETQQRQLAAFIEAVASHVGRSLGPQRE